MPTHAGAVFQTEERRFQAGGLRKGIFQASACTCLWPGRRAGEASQGHRWGGPARWGSQDLASGEWGLCVISHHMWHVISPALLRGRWLKGTRLGDQGAGCGWCRGAGGRREEERSPGCFGCSQSWKGPCSGSDIIPEKFVSTWSSECDLIGEEGFADVIKVRLSR